MEEKEEKEIDAGDTIYSFASGAGDKGTKIVDDFLTQTSREERIASRFEKRGVDIHRGTTTKMAAKSIVATIDNGDFILAGLSYSTLLIAMEMAQKGHWMEAILFLVGSFAAAIAKNRVEEGPITKLIKMPTKELKSKLVDLGMTFRGR